MSLVACNIMSRRCAMGSVSSLACAQNLTTVSVTTWTKSAPVEVCYLIIAVDVYRSFLLQKSACAVRTYKVA